MADIESSYANINSISPYYGNLFQRIQFHGIVLNHTKNDYLPYDAYCPSLQTKLLSRICSICKQYIPTSIRLHNHYKIHQENNSYDNIYKNEFLLDDNDFNDPYDFERNLTDKSVYLFTDIVEWLRSDFEDEPIVDCKTKSIAATASAMIRKERQMVEQEKSIIINSNEEKTIIENEFITTTEIIYTNDNQNR